MVLRSVAVFGGDAADLFDAGDALENFASAVIAEGEHTFLDGDLFDAAGGFAAHDKRADIVIHEQEFVDA